MHRRPIGRGRALAVVAAVVILVGCVLPWYGVGGGTSGLPAHDFRAFDGSGILAFIAALAVLALVTLPYAAGDRPVSLDRGLAYILICVVAILGVLLWPADPNLLGNVAGLLPNRAPGFWIAVGGVVILVRAVYDIAREPAFR